MKKLISIIILFISLFGIKANAAELPEFPFVFAEGKAETSVIPDIARVSFHVLGVDENEMNALDIVHTRSAELIDFLSTLKIDKEDIEAYNIDKKAIRERRDSYVQFRIIGYEIKRQFLVKLRNLSDYDKLVTKMLSLNNVTNIDAEFDRTDRDIIEADLIAKASQKAKENASLMAKGFGVKLGPVFAISQRDFTTIASVFSR